MSEIEGPEHIYEQESGLRFVNALEDAIYVAIESRLLRVNVGNEAGVRSFMQMFQTKGYLGQAVDLSVKLGGDGQLFDVIRVKLQKGRVVSHDEWVGGIGRFETFYFGFMVVVFRHALACEAAEIAEYHGRGDDVEKFDREAYWLRSVLERCAEAELGDVYKVLFRGTISPPKFIIKNRGEGSRRKAGWTTFAHAVAEHFD